VIESIPDLCPLVAVLTPDRTPHLIVTVKTVEVVGSFQPRFIDMINAGVCLLGSNSLRGEGVSDVAIFTRLEFQNIPGPVTASTILFGGGNACRMVVTHGTIGGDVQVHVVVELDPFI
jgi:hypothetical protein